MWGEKVKKKHFPLSTTIFELWGFLFKQLGYIESQTAQPSTEKELFVVMLEDWG